MTEMTTAAERTLLDTIQALVPPRPGVEALDDVLPEILAVMAERLHCTLRWLVATVGTDPLVRALAETVEPGNLVAAMVDEGVLVQPVDGAFGAELIETIQGPMAGFYRDMGVPLYRLADQETDRD